MPSFSTTSPLPHKLDTDRLPCLATLAPAAAAMADCLTRAVSGQGQETRHNAHTHTPHGGMEGACGVDGGLQLDAP